MSSFMNTTDTKTDTITAKTLVLNGTSATGIETGVGHTADDKLVALSALKEFTTKVNNALKTIDPDGDLYANLAAISLPLTDAYFSRPKDWVVSNWYLLDNYAIYTGSIDTDGNNSLTINNSIYPKEGHYFIIIDVANIESGYVELQRNGEWIATLDEAREYIYEFEIKDITTDKISLVAKGVTSGEKVVINSISIHYLTTRFYKYFTDALEHKFSITPDNFITVEAYEQAQREFTNLFTTLTTRYLAELDAHKSARNPHSITPEMIGAAAADHSHSEYLSSEQCAAEVERTMRNYAKANHTHDQYVTVDDAHSVIVHEIDERMKDVIVTSPLTVIKGPVGKLPSRWQQTNVSAPAQLLIPSTLSHWGGGSYDHIYGTASTNLEALIHECSKVFNIEGDFATISNEVANWGNTPITFKFDFHTKRKLAGYRIITASGTQLTDWKVITGNTTFIHRVTDPENVEARNYGNVCEIYFDATIEADSIGFQLLNAIPGEESLQLRIELLVVDLDNNSFGITNEEFVLSVPNSGANHIYRHEPTAYYAHVTPRVVVDGTPLYVFASPRTDDDGDIHLDISTSYYPPEMNNTRKGLNVLLDKYNDIEADPEEGVYSYTHPAFGTLSLAEGHSKTGSKLTNIYNSSNDGWRSEGNTQTVTITQTFTSDNVIISGYLMNWRYEDVGSIPTSWTLSMECLNEDDEIVTVVLDSVDEYYPFYSVEDDDIVYHAKLHNTYRVKKLILTMNTSLENAEIALNKVFFYVSEYYYAVPLNTMYLGNTPVKSICLGSMVHNQLTGWVPQVQTSIGKTCVIPVNNMEPTMRFMEYRIPNPFFTQDVNVSVDNYILQDSDAIGNSPNAYISRIDPEEIVVTTATPWRHAIAISRIW